MLNTERKFENRLVVSDFVRTFALSNKKHYGTKKNITRENNPVGAYL